MSGERTRISTLEIDELSVGAPLHLIEVSMPAIEVIDGDKEWRKIKVKYYEEADKDGFKPFKEITNLIKTNKRFDAVIITETAATMEIIEKMTLINCRFVKCEKEPKKFSRESKKNKKEGNNGMFYVVAEFTHDDCVVE